MASPQVGSISAKLSFAKVAAMNAPKVAVTIPNASDDKVAHQAEPKSRRKSTNSAKSPRPMSPPKATHQPTIVEISTKPVGIEPITGAIEGLSLVKATSLAANGDRGVGRGDLLEDDQSHLSSSSLKQQSFDTKSMASVTTFAMDEKESIRPDDSASVRAVEDDEPLQSLSRNATFQSDSDVIMPSLRGGARQGAPGVTMATRRFHTLTNPPRFGDLPVSPVIEAEGHPQDITHLDVEAHEEHIVRMPSLPVAPDEKLVDALATPKDRLPILQLEEKYLDFIAQSRVEFMDLPPQNSFARLLAHKLADYYNLPHHINEDGQSIRIFHAPSIALPVPLSVLAKSIPIGPPQLPGAAAMKIMRRAGLGTRQLSAGNSTAASSSAPSKATSDAGVDTNSDEGLLSFVEGTPNRDKSKPTREEREAQYKAARDRIFGDFQESIPIEMGSTGENSTTISRSSSSSGKRKTRKHKAPKDDSFEARSAFIPSYGHMATANAQSLYQQPDQGYYGNSSAGFAPNTNYGTTPTQAYPGFDQGLQLNNTMNYGPSGPPSFGSSENWTGMQSPPLGNYFNYSQTTTGYQQNVSPMMAPMNNQYMQQPAPNMQQGPGWMNNQFQHPYQQQSNPSTPGPNNWSGYAPYQYGQLPAQNYASNPVYNNQHPVPGSYNRSLFNPQTRSFVPSNSPSRNGGRGGRKKTSPAGQHRNGVAPKPFAVDGSANLAMMPQRGQDFSNSSSPKPKEDSLQQRYGAPAHLPKKPPPSQVPLVFDVEAANTKTSQLGMVVNGGSTGGHTSSTAA